MTRSLFISYSSTDIVLAEELDGLLRRAGIDTWIAPREIRGGESFADRIVDGITRTDALVVLVTRSAAASPHVALELNLAVGRQKRILPLRIDRIVPDGSMGYFLGLSQWIDIERPISASADALIAGVERILDLDRPVVGPETTLRGPASSVEQLHAQRDAIVLGRCLAMVGLVHRAPRREAAVPLLTHLARTSELVAHRLGTSVPTVMFEPATVTGTDDAAGLVSTLAPVAERVGMELGSRHDQRTMRALQLSFRVTIAALHVADLSAPALDDEVRSWRTLGTDVELPRALLDDLAERVTHRREPAAACGAFTADAAAALELRLLHETEFARYRAAVWEMGAALSLAVVGRSEGASPAVVERMLATAELHARTVGLRPPPPADRTGDAPADGANVIHYMLDTLAKAMVDDIESLYGKRTSALLEAAVKSALLLILYSDEPAGYGTVLGTAIERALFTAAVPSDLWNELVTACRTHRPYAEVKDLVFAMRKSVGEHLAELLVVSRATTRS